MNKRVLRQFAVPNGRPNPKNGIFCAEQIEYVVRTAIKNIDHQRTLVLYIYVREDVLTGDHTPRWTMFQQKDGYITLCTDDTGTRWQRSMFVNLGKDHFFRDKCSFYSQADEMRVTRYCRYEKQKGFDSLRLFQLDLLEKKQRENELKKQRKIIERMKPVGALPRDIKGFMHRETLPQYIFYDYAKGKAPKNAYCTACKHDVSVAEAKHTGEGVCPRCKSKITFKSRGRRGYMVDRSTAQVIQRLGSNEMIIRFIKAYCRYPKSDIPELHVYENARVFLRWDGSKILASESFYYGYSGERITPWHPGDRPVFSRWQYNFEADCCGYLYHRDLDRQLKGTPWQYSALKEYYAGNPSPLHAGQYLQKYLRYPMLEYLVKLKLYRLATYVVYGDRDGSRYYNDSVLNSKGKVVTEVLGVAKKYIPLLQTIDPGPRQLVMLKAFLRENIRPDLELMKWCGENNIGEEGYITVPLRYMTPHKLMRYATEQFAAHRKISYSSPGYYSMRDLMSDYKDYLRMSAVLKHDMRSSFVLFPNDLKAEHDRVNDTLRDKEMQEYDREIARMFKKLQRRYGYAEMGFAVIPPHSAKEITQEGDKLHHCVGRYMKDVAKNKTVVLFVRKASAPEKPYCTIEVRNGDVVQARIQNNDAPPPDVTRFIESWKENVLYAPALERAA